MKCKDCKYLKKSSQSYCLRTILRETYTTHNLYPASLEVFNVVNEETDYCSFGECKEPIPKRCKCGGRIKLKTSKTITTYFDVFEGGKIDVLSAVQPPDEIKDLYFCGSCGKPYDPIINKNKEVKNEDRSSRD